MSVLPPDRGLPEIPSTFIFSRSIACFFPLATIVRAGGTTPEDRSGGSRQTEWCSPAMLSLFGATPQPVLTTSPQTGCIHSPTIEQAGAARNARYSEV